MWSKIVFSILFFSTLSVWSAFVDLSSNELYKRRGDHRDYYEKTIAMLKSGDIVRFKDGAQFTIERKLGQGMLSVIFAIRERPHQVLRLAKSLQTFEAIESVLEGYKEIAGLGVRVVEVDPQSNSYYVLAERISSDYLTIAEMVLNADFGQRKFFYNENFMGIPLVQQWRSIKAKNAPKIDPQLRQKMLESFWLFVKSIGRFHVISDLNESNVVYDRYKNEWIIIDWLKGSRGIKNADTIQESISEMMELLFRAFKYNQENGFKLSDEAAVDLAIIKGKTRAVLFKEKQRYVEAATRHLREQKRCEALLKESFH